MKYVFLICSLIFSAQSLCTEKTVYDAYNTSVLRSDVLRERLIENYVNLVYSDNAFDNCLNEAIKKFSNEHQDANLDLLIKIFNKVTKSKIRLDLIDDYYEDLSINELQFINMLNEARESKEFILKVVTEFICDYFEYYFNIITKIKEVICSNEFSVENIREYLPGTIDEYNKILLKQSEENKKEFKKLNLVPEAIDEYYAATLQNVFFDHFIENMDVEQLDALVKDKNSRIKIIKQYILNCFIQSKR